MRSAETLLILLTAALAGGCQTSTELSFAAEPAVALAPAGDDGLVELLRYGTAVRELDGRQLEEKYRELAGEYGAFWPSEAVIRLSLLLSAPNAPFHDIDQATRYLRDVIERDRFQSSEHTDLAKLLYYLLNERVYAASEDENLAALLGEARDRNERLSDELAAVRAELASERERRRTLQGQLDALKELEEQLSLDGIERP